MELRELTYHQEGDYLIPDLEIPEDSGRTYGKYGELRKKFLQEHRKGSYSAMLLRCTLTDHLADVDEVAREQVEQLCKDMALQEGVTEELKARDMLAWVGKVNSIKQRAEEIVLQSLIYV